eukprot:5369105-Alexandrium_andersonii.AAC.1
MQSAATERPAAASQPPKPHGSHSMPKQATESAGKHASARRTKLWIDADGRQARGRRPTARPGARRAGCCAPRPRRDK